MADQHTAAGRAKRLELLEKAKARQQRDVGPAAADDAGELHGSGGNDPSGGGGGGGTSTDEMRQRLAKLETQLAEKGADAARWRRALQTQREEHRTALEQLAGLQQANAALQVSQGLQLQSLWRIPTEAVG